MRLLSWRTLPWVLLALSLALNVFFVGGHYYARHMSFEDRMRHRNEQMADRLELDAAQRDAWNALTGTVLDERRELQTASAPATDALWQEMAKPQPDPARIEEALRATAEQRLVASREVADAALRFMATLNPEQRQRFAQMARERGYLGERPPRREGDRMKDR